LHVYNNSAGATFRLQGTRTADGEVGVINFSNITDITGGYIIGSIAVNRSGFDNGGAMIFSTATAASTPTERMRITSGGNVGIGTTSPSVKLQVEDSSSTSLTTLYLVNSSTAAVTTKQNNLSFRMTDTVGTRKNAFQLTAYSDSSGGNIENGGLIFSGRKADLDTEFMRITSGGNVGIGLTNPSSKLHIVGSTDVINATSTTTNARINIGHSGNGGYVGYANIGAGDASNTFYVTNGSGVIGSGITMNNAGYVGIGTTSPTTKLEVIGGTSNINGYADGSIQVTGLSPIAFVASSNLNPSLNRWGFKLREVNEGDFSIYDYRSSVNRVLINSSGDFGINTTAPAYKLEVYNSTGDDHIAAVGTAPSLQLMSANTGPANWATIGMATSANHFIVGSVAGDLAIANRGTTAGNMLFGFGSSEKMRLTSNGDLCINATATTASAKLYVNGIAAFGSVYVASLGTGTVYSNAGTLTNTNPSDYRLKNTIKPLTYGLNEVLQLNPKTFYYNDDLTKARLKYGFIAQEVKEVMPDLVRKLGADTDYLGLENEGIFVTLVNAIKELKQELDTLKNK
jgi:hypothetical protein